MTNIYIGTYKAVLNLNIEQTGEGYDSVEQQLKQDLSSLSVQFSMPPWVEVSE